MVDIMECTGVREAAQRIVDKLPDQATWEDLMYQIYVRKAIEAGVQDSEAGRKVSVQEVRRRFGLKEWPFIGHRTTFHFQDAWFQNMRHVT